MRKSVLVLLIFSLIIPLAINEVNKCTGNRCTGSISLSANVPKAVKAGQRVGVSASMSGNCECGITTCSLSIKADNGDCQTSGNCWGKSGYCNVGNAPGGEFQICASGSFEGPPCSQGDLPGSTGPMMECSSRAYIVGVPDFSASANPTTLPKQGSITIKASKLDAIDDGYGTLSVIASFNGDDYTLSKVGSGTFERTINYDMRNKPTGVIQITVTVTKTYSGVSDSKSKSLSVMLQGSPPSISVNAPSEVKRGDTITIMIDEADGDDVEASLELGGGGYSLSRGNNPVRIDLPKGEYSGSVQARDVDGSVSKGFNIRVLGSPPTISLSILDQMKRGDSFTVTVEEEDGDSVTASVTIGGRSFSIGRGSNTVKIPRDLEAGQYTIEAVARDEDGEATARASFTLMNEEPKVSVSVDKTRVSVGEAIKIRVEASDDSPGLDVRTIVGDKEFSGVGTFEYIPRKEGTLTVKVVATDMDGVSVTDEISVEVTASSGGGSSGGSGSGSGGSSGGGSSSSSNSSSGSSGGSGSSSNSSEGIPGNSTLIKVSGVKNETVRLEVHPPEPCVGDEVTVKVFSPYKGLLALVNPEKREVANTGLTVLKYIVDEEGTWVAKFYYNDGKPKVASLSFTVKAKLVENMDNEMNNTVESKLKSELELKTLSIPCEVPVKNVFDVPWYLLAITTLFIVLAVRRLKL